MAEIEKILDEHFEFDPLYTFAVIKVSNELREQPLRHVEEILEDTLTDLEIDPGQLEAYVRKHRNSLEETCRRIGI